MNTCTDQNSFILEDTCLKRSLSFQEIPKKIALLKSTLLESEVRAFRLNSKVSYLCNCFTPTVPFKFHDDISGGASPGGGGGWWGIIPNIFCSMKFKLFNYN